MSGANVSGELAPFWALAVAAKACLVLAGALLVTRFMRRRPAAERHLVWVVAVAAVLALPLLTLALPATRVALPDWVPWPARDVGPVPPGPPVVVVVPGTRGRVLPAPAAVAVPPWPAPAPIAPRRPSALPRAAPPPMPGRAARASTRARALPEAAIPSPPTPPAKPMRRSAIELVVLVWLAGVAGVIGVILSGLGRVAVYARRARPVQDRVLQVRAYGLAAELGVGRVRLLEGAADVMPMAFGIVRPTVLLPETARSWTKARQETVLRHELAHIRRRDSLSQLAAELACALHWFNPLVWLAARRLYVEREHACDDLVLVSGSRPTDYAAELLDIARTARARRIAPLAAIAMARPSQLRRRIAALLEERPRRAALSGRLLVPAWVGAFVLMVPLSSLAPSLRAPLRTPQASRVAHSPAPDDHGVVTWRTMPRVHASGRVVAAPLVQAAPVATGPTVRAAAQLPAAMVAGVESVFFQPAPVALIATMQSGVPGVQAQQDCLSRGRNRSINHNDDDRRTTVKWSGDDCSGEVEIDGDIQFDADFTTITGLSRGGSIRLIVEEGRDERRLMIRSPNGALTYEYSLNGRRAEFDAAAQRWLSATMLFLFRNVGLMAEERATAILQRRGADALLAEIGLLGSDHVRAQYLEVLVAQGRLDERSLQRVLELAGSTLRSDHYRTQVIMAVAGRYQFTDAVRQAYIDAASQMSSDHYRHQAFSTVLQRGNLTPAQVSAVLREARRISSDHYRAELLRSMRNGYGMTPEIRAAYLEAAAGLSSDHYKAGVLAGLLDTQLSPAEIARVLATVQSVASDHYRADLLSKLGAMNLREPAVQLAFVRAASEIDSDHYKHVVLQKAAARPDLDRAALLAILDAAATIRSDHYLSELLVDVARRHRLTGDVRERFLKAMEGIGSAHYRGNVADVLLRQERS